MSRPTIADFLFDDSNEAKIASHGLTARQVMHILDSPFTRVANRRGRRAEWLLIGRDHGGRCIAVPVEPTHDPTLWRPVTAWPCKGHEAARLP
jgi:hypothetical protein